MYGVSLKINRRFLLNQINWWMKKLKFLRLVQNQALSIIYLNIDTEFKRIIENCRNPIDAWKRLKWNYCPDSRSHHMKIFTDLTECKIKPNEPINFYSSWLSRVSNNIKQIDKTFNDVYVNFQILRFLPQKFDSIVQSTLRWWDANFVHSKITEELITEETRLNVRDMDSSKSYLQSNQLSFGKKKPNINKF